MADNLDFFGKMFPTDDNYIPVEDDSLRFPIIMLQPSSSDGGSGQAGQLAIDWPVVLDEHDHWLRGVVFARVRRLEAVDEVMQEVALAAIRQAAPISDRSKIAPWLYRLAVRQSLLYYRRMGRRHRLVEQYATNAVPASAGSGAQTPLDWLLKSERSEIVRHSLEKMAPRDSEILMLKYGEGWNYHQIATHLGVSHSAVETRLHRARRRLRDQLAKTDVNEVA